MSARLTRNAKTKSSLALFIRFTVVILRPVLTLHIENAEHAIVWVTMSPSCLVKCKDNSECHSGEYCCRKKRVYIWQDRCSKTCEGEDCDSDEDCGPPNECCIAGKCTINGCSECSADSDCTYCCRSGKCVDRSVCFGCASDSNCSIGQVGCKKSFPLNQTVCAGKCDGLNCNNNDDCATGRRECCRDGKCVGGPLSLSCLVKCKDNSECHAGEYCCRKKRVWFRQDRCSRTCEGEDCDSDEHCGPPNECCISGKCTKHGCSGCSSDSDCTYCCRSGKCADSSVCFGGLSGSDCTSGQVCCMKSFAVNQTVCADKCDGLDCNNNDDCATGLGECCRDGKCVDSSVCGPKEPSAGPKREPSGSQKPADESSQWRVAVIITAVLLLIAVSASVYWRYKTKRPNNAKQARNFSGQVKERIKALFITLQHNKALHLLFNLLQIIFNKRTKFIRFQVPSHPMKTTDTRSLTHTFLLMESTKTLMLSKKFKSKLAPSYIRPTLLVILHLIQVSTNIRCVKSGLNLARSGLTT